MTTRAVPTSEALDIAWSRFRLVGLVGKVAARLELMSKGVTRSPMLLLGCEKKLSLAPRRRTKRRGGAPVAIAEDTLRRVGICGETGFCQA